MDIDVIAGGSDVQINLTSFLGGGEQYVNFPNFLRNRLHKKVVWNEVERAWLRLKKEAVNGPNYSLQKGIEYRLKESFTGCFLHHLNKGEDTSMEIQQKKLDIAKFLLRINEFPTVYERRHDYSENIMGLLVNTVSQSKNGVVTESSVLKNMPSLRLAASKIASMDYTLKDCGALEALILTANYITDFDGIVLPSNLKLLELYGNLLFDIDLLAKNAPKRLLFIGLGRNYLSRPHSIKLLNRFIYLCYLDLSDNDFENIDDLVQNLSYLKSLKSLQIVGNPCTVLSNYKAIVMLGLPNLEILDGVELDRRSHEPGQETREAVLSIYGFRIYNIPKPIRVTMSKKEKVESYYQLEVELPLLDEKLAAYETNVLTHELNGVPLPIIPDLDEVPRTIERPPRKVAPRIFKPSSLSKRERQSGQPTPRMKQHESEILENLESRYYDYLENDEEIFMAKKYLSNKVQWAPVLKFPSPAFSVTVPLENIRMLRDTFRTVMNIRLYHKEEISLIPVGKSKSRVVASARKSRLSVKKRQSKRVTVKIGKKQPKIGGGGAGGGGDQKASIPGNPVKTLTRNLICKIPVPLQMTNWAEDYMGYTWDIKDHCLARPYPGLKNINVGMKTKRGRVSAARKDGYMPMPKMLTCHIGVGLKRTGTYERMASFSKINLKKKSKVNKSIRRPSSKSSRGSKLSKQSKI